MLKKFKKKKQVVHPSAKNAVAKLAAQRAASPRRDRKDEPDQSALGREEIEAIEAEAQDYVSGDLARDRRSPFWLLRWISSTEKFTTAHRWLGRLCAWLSGRRRLPLRLPFMWKPPARSALTSTAACQEPRASASITSADLGADNAMRRDTCN